MKSTNFQQEYQQEKTKPKNLSQKLDAQMEKLVYKIMTNDGLEETINLAIQKALTTIVIRYFIIIVIGVLFLLFLQNLILTIILKHFFSF